MNRHFSMIIPFAVNVPTTGRNHCGRVVELLVFRDAICKIPDKLKRLQWTAPKWALLSPTNLSLPSSQDSSSSGHIGRIDELANVVDFHQHEFLPFFCFWKSMVPWVSFGFVPNPFQWKLFAWKTNSFCSSILLLAPWPDALLEDSGIKTGLTTIVTPHGRFFHLPIAKTVESGLASSLLPIDSAFS